MRQLIIIIVA